MKIHIIVSQLAWAIPFNQNKIIFLRKMRTEYNRQKD